MAFNGDVSSPSPTGGVITDGLVITMSAHLFFSGGGTLLSFQVVGYHLTNLRTSITAESFFPGSPGPAWNVDPGTGKTFNSLIDLNAIFGDVGGDNYSRHLNSFAFVTGGPDDIVRWNDVNTGPYFFTSGDGSPSKPTTPTPTDTDTGIILLPTLNWQAG